MVIEHDVKEFGDLGMVMEYIVAPWLKSCVISSCLDDDDIYISGE